MRCQYPFRAAPLSAGFLLLLSDVEVDTISYRAVIMQTGKTNRANCPCASMEHRAAPDQQKRGSCQSDKQTAFVQCANQQQKNILTRSEEGQAIA